MGNDDQTKADVCPIHPSSRNAWLESQASQTASPHISTVKDSQDILSEPSDVINYKIKLQSVGSNLKCLWDSVTSWPAPPHERAVFNNSNINRAPITSLGFQREVSSIPRTHNQLIDGDNYKKQPANCERESGVSPEGNWIYPSEKMFYDAIRRKGYSSQVEDMKTIVPIHNAVNERAWKEIKKWEEPWGSEK